MADPIRPQDARDMATVLTTPELGGELTIRQAGQMRKKLQSFQNEQAARLESFAGQGLSEEDARKLLAQENAALDDGSYQRGGNVARISPVPGESQVNGLARAINTGAEGVTRAVEGAGDLMNEIGVTLNIQSREDADNYKNVVGSNRFKRAMEDIEDYGRVNNRFLEVVGEAAPWMATATVGTTAGLIRYGLAQGMVGGLASVSSVTDSTLEERSGAFGIGAGLGAAFGGIFGIPGNLKAGAARAITSKLNAETAAANVELEKAVQKMLDDGDFGFSMSQVTGDRFIFGLEARAAGSVQKGRQNQNIQGLYDNILSEAKRLGDEGRSANEIGLVLRDTLTEANRAIHKRASQQFGDGLEEITEKYGTDIVLNYRGGQNYLAQLDDMMARQADPLKPGPGPTAAFKKYRGEVDRIVNPATPQQRVVKGPDGKNRRVYDVVNRRTGEVTQLGQTRAQARAVSMQMNETLGGMQAGELRRVQEGLNDLLRGKTAVLDSPDPNTNKHLAKALMGNLFENLDANAANPQAVADLKGLTDMYKGEMLRVEKMENLVVARMFGMKDMPFDADAALDTVLAGGTSSLKGTRQFLEEWNPELLGELQGTLLRRILEKAGDVTAPGVDVPIALDKYATALAGRGPDARVIGQVGRGLFDDATQANLETTGEALRTIKNLYFTGIAPGGVTIDDAAINVVSRSPEFMSRFLTRALTTGKGMDAVLTDPLTRQAIITIAQKGPTSRAGNAAMLVLTNWITANDADDQKQKRSEVDREVEKIQSSK